MIQATAVEQILEEAIGLLVSSGYPLAADHLRTNLRAIASAPTAAAKRRRVLRLVEVIDRSGIVTEARYRGLLRRIREVADGNDRAA